MAFALSEITVEKISVMVPVNSLAVQIVITKTSLVYIFVCEFEDTEAVLHAATPISLVLCPRKEIVPAVPVYFIVDETSRVFLA